MVFFHGGSHAAHHQQGLVFRRFGNLHHLEAAGQGRVFLDVLFVLGPGGGSHGTQGATGQGRLEQVGCVTGAGSATGTHQGMGFVDKQDDRLGRGLHVFDDLAQALFELAFHAGAGLQQAHVEAAQLHVFQGGRHVTGDDAQGETFDHGGLAHPGFTGEDRVVLAPTHEDVHQLANLLVTAHDGVELAAAGLFGQVHSETLERFLLAHRAGRHGTAGLAWHTGIETVAGAQGIFRRVTDVFVKALAQGLGLDLVELAGQAQQRMAQARCLQDAQHQITGANLAFTEHQAAIHPAAFHGFFHMGGQVGDRRRATRQAIQGFGEVAGQARRLHVELTDDAVQVRVLQLQQLVKPVGQFHIRIAP